MVAKAFPKTSLLRNEFKFLSRHTEMAGLWRHVSKEYFSVLPEEIYRKILWRGIPMSDVFINNFQTFIFYKEWQALSLRVDARVLFVSTRANVVVFFSKAYLDIKRYIKEWFKFHL